MVKKVIEKLFNIIMMCVGIMLVIIIVFSIFFMFYVLLGNYLFFMVVFL